MYYNIDLIKKTKGTLNTLPWSHMLQSGIKDSSKISLINSPFWVSFVEQTRVEIWKESLLMVQLPRFCMLFPVVECPFSSNSILVDGKLKYVDASSNFFASAYRIQSTMQTILENQIQVLQYTRTKLRIRYSTSLPRYTSRIYLKVILVLKKLQATV